MNARVKIPCTASLALSVACAGVLAGESANRFGSYALARSSVGSTLINQEPPCGVGETYCVEESGPLRSEVVITLPDFGRVPEASADLGGIAYGSLRTYASADAESAAYATARMYDTVTLRGSSDQPLVLTLNSLSWVYGGLSTLDFGLCAGMAPASGASITCAEAPTSTIVHAFVPADSTDWQYSPSVVNADPTSGIVAAYESDPGTLAPIVRLLIDTRKVSSFTFAAIASNYAADLSLPPPVAFLSADLSFDVPEGVTATRASLAPIPEPASWALLIAGAAMLGFAAVKRTMPSAPWGLPLPDVLGLRPTT